MPTRIKQKLPKLQMRAEFVPASLNEEDRTIDVVWTTGHKGMRRTPFGNYFEELSLEPSAVDMNHLRSGRAKFLASHDMQSLDSVIGVVARAEIGTAKIRFAKDEISERNLQKVRDGILTDISVGYLVDEYTDVSGPGDEVPTYRATKWTPIEISLVAQGFDPGAVVRSSENIEMNEVEIIGRSQNTTSEGESMPPENKNAEGQTVDTEALKQEAAKLERERAAGIRTLVREHKLDEKVADEMIARGDSLVQAKTNVEMLARYVKQTQETPVSGATRVEFGATEGEKKREAIENALLHRLDEKTQLSSGREFRGMSLIRICEELIGGRKGMSDAEIAKRAMTTSDFPLILANIAEKSLAERYRTAPETFSKWTRKGKLKNYKQHSKMRVGDFPSLSERTEEGEFTYGQISESKEVVQLKKYGKILAFSEELLIGDDLDALGDFVTQAGNAARRLESKLVYDVLMTNPAMYDTYNLFSSEHANLGTDGDISETTMDELNQKLKAQKTLDGEDFLDIFAKYVICGPKSEVKVRKFLASIVANQTGNVNVFQGSVDPIVENRITDERWILTADPAQYDTVTLFHLEGAEAPRVSTRNKWESGAFEIKVEHAAAAKALDHRGMAANLNP